MAVKSSKAPENAPPSEQPFEQSLDELEDVVRRLESSELPLEQALELFEKGVQLSESCRRHLSAAETRVEILLRKGDKFEAEPFQPEVA